MALVIECMITMLIWFEKNTNHRGSDESYASQNRLGAVIVVIVW